MESLKTIGAQVADLRITLKETSDDSEYSDEYLYKLMSDTRALLLHRELTQYRKLSDWNYQTICVKLEPSTYHDCDCIADLGCKVMKSINKIPKPLMSRFKNYIKVYNILQDYEIDKSTPMQLKRDKYSLTRSGKRGYDIINDHLVLFNSMGVDTVLIRGIFEDPAYAATSSACDDPVQSCDNPMDSEFPLDTRFIPMMKEMIVKGIMGTMQITNDITNNDRTTFTEQKN